MLEGGLPADWRLISGARSVCGTRQPRQRADGYAGSTGACQGQGDGTSQRNRCGELRILCSLFFGPTALHNPVFFLAVVPTRLKSKRLKPLRDLLEGRPWRCGCPALTGPVTFRHSLTVAMALWLCAIGKRTKHRFSTQQFDRSQQGRLPRTTRRQTGQETQQRPPLMSEQRRRSLLLLPLGATLSIQAGNLVHHGSVAVIDEAARRCHGSDAVALTQSFPAAVGTQARRRAD